MLSHSYIKTRLFKTACTCACMLHCLKIKPEVPADMGMHACKAQGRSSSKSLQDSVRRTWVCMHVRLDCWLAARVGARVGARMGARMGACQICMPGSCQPCVRCVTLITRLVSQARVRCHTRHTSGLTGTCKVCHTYHTSGLTGTCEVSHSSHVWSHRHV